MEKEKIMQTINDLQSTYENVHIHIESRCCVFDIWGSTNNTNNTVNEWTKNIVYTDDGVLCIKNVLHGVVMDERDNICLNGIITSSINVEPSIYWEDGMYMDFLQEDGSMTFLDFFN
jgi:hypothetical protein